MTNRKELLKLEKKSRGIQEPKEPKEPINIWDIVGEAIGSFVGLLFIGYVVYMLVWIALRVIERL